MRPRVQKIPSSKSPPRRMAIAWGPRSRSLTGRGGDILIVDDPLKPGEASTKEALWVNNMVHNTLLSRLDNMTTGAIIVVMQRLHEDDLTGALLRSSDNWVLLSLPAIAEVDEKIQIGPGKFHHSALVIFSTLSGCRAELEARRNSIPKLCGPLPAGPDPARWYHHSRSLGALL